MSDYEESVDGDPPAIIDPYELLGIDKTATADEVKSAYRKAALKNHPGRQCVIVLKVNRYLLMFCLDKVGESEREEAKEKFQSIAFAYAILSDSARRKRYDTTGSTSESIVDADGFNWSDFYREQYKDSVSSDAIEKFAKKYKGSDEEKDDLLIAYEECEGDMDELYERVILSNVLEDDRRLRKIIDEAIKQEDVPAFTTYTKESKAKRAARIRKAKEESGEAEEYAKELGVHEQLFGGKKGKGSKGASSEEGLAALIQKRQQSRSEDFFDHLAEKYAPKSGGKKGKKRPVEDEPSEEAFQAAASKLKKGKK